jgi:hypothetical protein
MAVLQMDWLVVVDWATTSPTIRTGAMGIARSVVAPIPEELVGRDLPSSAPVRAVGRKTAMNPSVDGSQTIHFAAMVRLASGPGFIVSPDNAPQITLPYPAG